MSVDLYCKVGCIRDGKSTHLFCCAVILCLGISTMPVKMVRLHCMQASCQSTQALIRGCEV